MRILLLDPQDWPSRGPWSAQRWDLIVDLGRSSAFSTAAWSSQAQCPILRLDSYRRGIEDHKVLRESFSIGRGRLWDEEGLDWWDLTFLLIAPEVEGVLALERLVREIPANAELSATRSGSLANILGILRGQDIHVFSSGSLARLTNRAAHYYRQFGRFSPNQIREILLDKYDSGQRWRSRFTEKPAALPAPVVLLPSAYGNVTRMAADYARLLPEEPFLLVTTRDSGKLYARQPNVTMRSLSAYAGGAAPARETQSIMDRWAKLKAELSSAREFQAVAQVGSLDTLPGWFRDGLQARDAWRSVFDREPIRAVLCGDDSNLYTRLPVLLASRRKIPTLDFHHGALDGRYLLKRLPCDTYLAKSEMERDYLVRECELPSDKVVIAGPWHGEARSSNAAATNVRSSVVLFSEPYESAGMRAAEVYRELLPPLCRLARENGRGVIIKLHPFESAPERRRMLQSLLAPEDHAIVTVLDGPLSGELLSQVWFGITVESTTVMDCLSYGVPCFLCGWLKLSSYGYAEQYARFRVGEILHDVSQVSEIPRRMGQRSSANTVNLWETVEPGTLRRLLAGNDTSSVEVPGRS